MINIVSQALAVFLHVALVVLLGMVSLEIVVSERPTNGMVIELIDFAQALPELQPLSAATSDSSSSNPQRPEGEPEAVEVTPKQPPRTTTEIKSNSPAAELVLKNKASISQPKGKSIRERPGQVVSAKPAIQPMLSERVPTNLGTTDLSDLLMIQRRDPEPSIDKSANLESTIGETARQDLKGLTYRQKVDLAEKIRSQVTPCWNPPPANDAAAVRVRLRFRLDRHGRVVRKPVQTAVSGISEASAAYINLLTNSGRNAILMCSPLKLPSELYDAWADVEVEFNSRGLR